MRISDLQNKTVINLIDGKNIGKTLGLIVKKHKFIISNFTSKKEISIKWEQIDKIGEDVILVKVVY